MKKKERKWKGGGGHGGRKGHPHPTPTPPLSKKKKKNTQRLNFRRCGGPKGPRRGHQCPQRGGALETGAEGNVLAKNLQVNTTA